MDMHRALVCIVLVALATTACERADARSGSGPASGPVGDLRDATLEVTGGADTVSVRSEDLGDDLYVIAGPDGSDVERDDGVIRVRLDDDDADADADADGDDGDDEVRRGPVWDDENPNGRWAEGRGDAGVDETDDADDIEIRLNSRVRWTLRLTGGADATTVDMSAGHLAGVEFAAGVTRIRLALPRPDGTVAVRMLAGASEFDVTAPAGVPARVRLGSGAGSVTVDGSTRTGVAQGTVLTPPSWESAADRYDIEAVAGVSRLTLARR
jgi:hypothetical protein